MKSQELTVVHQSRIWEAVHHPYNPETEESARIVVAEIPSACTPSFFSELQMEVPPHLEKEQIKELVISVADFLMIQFR